MAKAKKNNVLSLEEMLEQALVPVDEQPYEVPKNWCWTYLENVCEYMRAGGDKPRRFSDVETEEYRIPIVANGIQSEGIIGYTNVKNEKAGTITVSGRGTIGYAMFRNYSYYPVVRLIVLSPQVTCVDGKYLKYIFDYFEEEGTGSSIPQLTVPSIKRKQIPLPPLAEQQRIVEQIESLFAKLDETSEKLSDVVEKLEVEKQSVLYDAFNGLLTRKWRKMNGVPDEVWTPIPFTEVFDLKSGTTIAEDEEQNEGKIPYLKVSDMNLEENLIQITTSTRFVDECSESQIIPSGSTIFPKRGGAILTNKKRYVSTERIIADLNIMAILPKTKKAIGWFGYYWMQSIDLKQLNNGSSVPQINNKDMVKLFLGCPSIEEQEELVKILHIYFEKYYSILDNVNKSLEQIELIKKSILAKAFRGELGTNNPEEESSLGIIKSTLLEKNKEETNRIQRKDIQEDYFVERSILEVLDSMGKLTPEKLKMETKLDIDAFYEKLKELIEANKVIESRVKGEIYLEAKYEDR